MKPNASVLRPPTGPACAVRLPPGLIARGSDPGPSAVRTSVNPGEMERGNVMLVPWLREGLCAERTAAPPGNHVPEPPLEPICLEGETPPGLTCANGDGARARRGTPAAAPGDAMRETAAPPRGDSGWPAVRGQLKLAAPETFVRMLPPGLSARCMAPELGARTSAKPGDIERGNVMLVPWLREGLWAMRPDPAPGTVQDAEPPLVRDGATCLIGDEPLTWPKGDGARARLNASSSPGICLRGSGLSDLKAQARPRGRSSPSTAPTCMDCTGLPLPGRGVSIAGRLAST